MGKESKDKQEHGLAYDAMDHSVFKATTFTSIIFTHQQSFWMTCTNLALECLEL